MKDIRKSREDMKLIKDGCYYSEENIQTSVDNFKKTFWIWVPGVVAADSPSFSEKKGQFDTSWGGEIDDVDIDEIANDLFFSDFCELDRDEKDKVLVLFKEKVEEKIKEGKMLLLQRANLLIKNHYYGYSVAREGM